MAANCLQYLLAVSERIINGCADDQTLRKYYALKDKIIEKWTVKGKEISNNLCAAQKENKKFSSIVRSSFVLNQSYGSRVQNARQSLRKSQAKSSKVLEKGRVQTHTSKKSSDILREPSQQIVLTQIAAILTNVQACPSILRTIRLTLDNHDERVEALVKSIEQSLKNIYHSHIRPLKTQAVTIQNFQKQKQLNLSQLITDNQWLISKLQHLINQNSTLRRMVGRKVY